MKRLSLLLLSCLSTTILHAQLLMELEAEKQGFKNGVHWVKRNWYNPLNGTTEPDKSSIPNIYLHPNQLIEYSREGKLKSMMDYEAGSDDKSGSTERYIWKDGRLMQKVHENNNYEALYTTIYSYNADGLEIKRETKSGPGDKMGIFAGLATTEEKTWSGNQLATHTNLSSNGNLQSRTRYNYDAMGRKTREDYEPSYLYLARIYEYDEKGNLVKDTYLDKDGKPSTIWAHEYNAAGKPVKTIKSHFFKGKKDSEEVTSYTYNTQGDKTSEKTLKDGKVIWDYSWQHKYDAKGNRIQTAHIKAGKPEYIEVLGLLYHKQQ